MSTTVLFCEIDLISFLFVVIMRFFLLFIVFHATDGAVSCLMAALHKHAQWKQVTNLITKTMSTLVCGKIGMKFVKLFRIGGCCSALVQAVCVHYLGDDRASSVEMGQEERKRSEKGKGKGFVQNTSSLMLLTNVLRTICDLIDCDRIDLTSVDYTEICNCRSCLILEGAHEAVALLMRTHNINATAYTDCISSIGESIFFNRILHNYINRDCIQRSRMIYLMHWQLCPQYCDDMKWILI